VAVPDAHLLVAMGGSDAGSHVEDHASWRTPGMDPVDPLTGSMAFRRRISRRIVGEMMPRV
jgi:hypothetical protein